MEPEGLPETGWIPNKGKWIKSVVKAYTPPLVKVVAFNVEVWFWPSGWVWRDTLRKEQDVYKAVSNEPDPDAGFFGSRF